MARSVTRPQLRVDAVLALVFLVVGQLQLFVPNQDGYVAGPLWLNSVVAVLTAVPLALRRVYPVAVAAGVLGLHLLLNLTLPHTSTFWGTLLPMIIALYSAARYGPAELRRSALQLVLPLLMVLTLGLHTPGFSTVADYLFPLLLLGGCWAVGRLIGHHQRQSEALTEALAELGRSQELGRRQVLLQERARIAREMHDVVAHGVSVMVVQSGSARLELGPEDDAARESLHAVESTGRSVLTELRSMVTLLRADEESSDAPAPTIHELHQLVEQMRVAGLDVELQVDPRTDLSLDSGRGLTVYRIVQEALTNTLRHSGRSHVTVRVRSQPELTVEVVDDGPSGPRPAPPTSGGHGLIEIRERVGMYGGRLEVGPHGPGYAVRATLPAPVTA